MSFPLQPRSLAEVIHPPCVICGGIVERITFANGERQSVNKWLRCQSCPGKCRLKLYSLRTREQLERRRAAYQHPPCAHCGNPVPRRGDEPLKRWRSRRCCCDECAISLVREGSRRAHEYRRAAGSWFVPDPIDLPPNCFAGMDVRTVSAGRIGSPEPSLRRQAIS